jgi:hypothetical protein
MWPATSALGHLGLLATFSQSPQSEITLSAAETYSTLGFYVLLPPTRLRDIRESFARLSWLMR